MAKGLDTRTTAVSEITTENPDTLTPDDFAMEALDVMPSRHFRHLPVTDDGKAIGMVPIRDLFAAVKMSLEEDIQENEAFVFGDQYGAGFRRIFWPGGGPLIPAEPPPGRGTRPVSAGGSGARPRNYPGRTRRRRGSAC